MSNVVDIDIARKRLYAFRRTIHQAGRRLRALETEVMDLAVTVAMAGSLRVWSESVPVGHVVSMSEELLAETGDARVLALLRLREAVHDTVAQLYSNDTR